MRHAATKHMFTYWRRLRGSAMAPARSAVNPVDIGRYLAGLMMLERSADSAVTLRIAGSHICSLFGKELRGDMLASLFLPAAVDDLDEMLTTVMEDGLPVIGGISALMAGRISLEAELLLLPLTHEGRTDRRILGALSVRSGERVIEGSCHALDILSVRVLTEDNTRFLHPPEPDLPFGTRVRERRGHLTVLDGGMA